MTQAVVGALRPSPEEWGEVTGALAATLAATQALLDDCRARDAQLGPPSDAPSATFVVRSRRERPEVVPCRSPLRRPQASPDGDGRQSPRLLCAVRSRDAAAAADAAALSAACARRFGPGHASPARADPQVGEWRMKRSPAGEVFWKNTRTGEKAWSLPAE